MKNNKHFDPQKSIFCHPDEESHKSVENEDFNRNNDRAGT